MKLKLLFVAAAFVLCSKAQCTGTVTGAIRTCISRMSASFCRSYDTFSATDGYVKITAQNSGFQSLGIKTTAKKQDTNNPSWSEFFCWNGAPRYFYIQLYDADVPFAQLLHSVRVDAHFSGTCTQSWTGSCDRFLYTISHTTRSPTPPPTFPTPRPTYRPTPPTPQPPTPRPTPPTVTPRPTTPPPTKPKPEKCSAVCAKSGSASISLRFLTLKIGLCRATQGKFPGLIATKPSIKCVYVDLQSSIPRIGTTTDFQCMCLPYSVTQSWSQAPSYPSDDCSNACVSPLVPLTSGGDYVCKTTGLTPSYGFNKKGSSKCVYPTGLDSQKEKNIGACLCLQLSTSGSLASAWKNMNGQSATISNPGSGNPGSGNTGSSGSNSGSVSPKKLPSGTVAVTVLLFVGLCCTAVAAVYFYCIKKDEAPANYESVQMT